MPKRIRFFLWRFCFFCFHSHCAVRALLVLFSQKFLGCVEFILEAECVLKVNWFFVWPQFTARFFFTSRIPIKYTSTAHQFIYFGRNSCTHGCGSYGRDMLITFVSICPSFVDPPPRCRILPAPTVERAVGLLARFGYEPATVRSGAGAFLNHEGPWIYSSGKDSQAPHQQLGCLLQYLSSSCFILPCVHQQEGMTVGDGGEKKGGSGC